MPGTLDPEKILTRLFGSVSRARILGFWGGRSFGQNPEKSFKLSFFEMIKRLLVINRRALFFGVVLVLGSEK